MEEVKFVVDCPSPTNESQAPFETSRMEQTVASMPTLPITVQVPKAAIKCGIPESNLDFQDTNQLIIDFSSMHMNDLYAVQNAVNTEIRLWEHHLATQVKVAHQDLMRLKS